MAPEKFYGIVISYMGNTDGRDEENENRLSYVKHALSKGLNVCVNVFFRAGKFYLPCGFDGDELESIPPVLLSNQAVWCNAVDAQTLDALCGLNAHCFSMLTAPHTLTSAQFIWTMPNRALTDRSIAAFPELADAGWLDTAEPAGLCSNQPLLYLQ